MLLVGTSGFSYDDWRGHWYPPGLPAGQMFAYYAERFPAVEINSTYYRTPPPRMFEALVRTAAGRVTFAIKLPQAITHRGQLVVEEVRPFLDAIAPVREAGRLGAILAQFPNAFRHDAAGIEFLAALQGTLGAYPLVVEIRHAGWQQPAALEFFRARRISLCWTDMPGLPGLPAPAHELTGEVAYLRLHGRNARNWYHRQNDYYGARYDYLYSAEELQPWVPVLREAAPRAQTTFAFFNNHINGQAAVNAQALMELLGQRPPSGYTDLFSGA